MALLNLVVLQLGNNKGDELMAKERGDSRRAEAEGGPSILVAILAIGIVLAALVLCFIWFLFFGM
jgi:hypothetical protein